ncbi:MAG: hydrogenase maturation protease [Candidatus Dormibacteraeota bacterium]|nr:hydrogenase maturation protease [Candidatus Dormibacteraeota bacterium]
MRILIAGMGNLLRRDDGFGVIVAQRLLDGPIPDGVTVMEVGIGGIHMVQALFDPTDGLVVLDAVDLGRHPGTIVVIQPEVTDLATLSLSERHDQLADMHYATPSRAFMLARGLAILPAATWLIGCQPVDAEGYGEGLSPEVQNAVEAAMAEVKALVSSMGVSWT